jgi:hypothetical protein
VTAGVKSGIALIDWIVTYVTYIIIVDFECLIAIAEKMMAYLGKTEATIKAVQKNESRNEDWLGRYENKSKK